MERKMDNTSGNLRMLSRGASASAPSSSLQSSSSSIILSSSSVPYTPPTSSGFNFPAPPTAHNISSYSHPACPPLPSVSLLNSASGRAFPSNNLGGKITILTSSAAMTPGLLPNSSTGGVPAVAEVPFSATGPGLFAVDTPLLDTSSSGIVVVGAVGRSETDVSQLLNRLLDSQVFGFKGCATRECISLFDDIQADYEKRNSISLDTLQKVSSNLSQKKAETTAGGQEQASGDYGKLQVNKRDTDVTSAASLKSLKRMSWMKKRLRHYHDEEKGAVYVQFAWGSSPVESVSLDDIDMPVEDFEECMLRGLLYMFSVCHILLLLQEGSRVDTHLLRTLRILQNAKHQLVPFVKSHVLSALHPTSIAFERMALTSKPSSHLAGQGPVRAGTIGRNASTIGLMSGSAPSFFPGQCTPVLLFVFLEEFNDVNVNSHSVFNPDDKTDSSDTLIQQSGGSIIPSRQAVHLKGSNAVVMLARATNRTEGGLRKKLQSSLEAQIRYLVKKCKVSGGFGDGGGIGIGPRGPGSSTGSASGSLGGSSLFVLDTMRAVFLLEKGPNLQGDSLKAAMNFINDMLKGKQEATNVLSDLSGNSTEDILALRDFVWRQAEILRGRGGIPANSSGSSMGVGMVAAAAAAAAASAAAGGFGGSGGALKPLGNPPELPSISSWLSACRSLLEPLLTGEGQTVKEPKKFQPVRSAGTRRGSFESGNVALLGKEALALTLGCLSRAADFDMRFSEEWCKRMFPAALATYTKALPPCYPTLVHECNVAKALHSFNRSVRGPAVSLYTDKLKVECEAIWKSGRQLCDAVSLTGRHCIHKVHHVTSPASLDGMDSLDAKDINPLNEQDESNSTEVKPHSSGVVFLHACACGRSRVLREDPFDLEMANSKFYQFPNCEDLLPAVVIPDCEGNKPLGGSAWSLTRLGGAKYYQHSSGLLQTGFSHHKKFLSPWIISYVQSFAKQNQSSSSVLALQSNQHILSPYVPQSSTGALSFLHVLEQGSSRSHHESTDAPHEGVSEENMGMVPEKTVFVERRGTFSSPAHAALEEKSLFADVVAPSIFDFPPLQPKQLYQKSFKQIGASGRKDAAQLFLPFNPDQRVTGTDNISFQKETASKDTGHGDLGTSTSTTAALDKFQEFGNVEIKNAVFYLGFEHECPRGHRYFLSMEQLEALGTSGIVEESLTASQQKLREIKKEMPKETKHQQDLLASSGFPGLIQARDLSVSDGVMDEVVKEGSGEGYLLLNTDLPIYMTCPFCNKLSDKKKKKSPAYAGRISQLQRIFLVTPPLPLLISTCPSVQFDEACVVQMDLKDGVGNTTFSLGCSVVLPPDSFVVLRLPFVYCLERNDGSKHALTCKTVQPERTAWLLKGTTFKVMTGSGGNV